MDTETAKNIGTKLAIKSISIGVIIAYLMMTVITSGVQTSFFEGLFWIIRVRSEAVQDFLIGIAAFYAMLLKLKLSMLAKKTVESKVNKPQHGPTHK